VQPLPRVALNGVSRGAVSDTVDLRQCACRFSGRVSRAYFDDLLRIQSIVSTSPLRHIPHVVGLGANDEVVWADTRPVVTGMANFQVPVYRADKGFMRNTRRCTAIRPRAGKSRVALAVESTGPYPAPSRQVAQDVTVKALEERLTALLGTKAIAVLPLCRGPRLECGPTDFAGIDHGRMVTGGVPGVPLPGGG
jgi:hypothetical protein